MAYIVMAAAPRSSPRGVGVGASLELLADELLALVFLQVPLGSMLVMARLPAGPTRERPIPNGSDSEWFRFRMVPISKVRFRMVPIPNCSDSEWFRFRTSECFRFRFRTSDSEWFRGSCRSRASAAARASPSAGRRSRGAATFGRRSHRGSTRYGRLVKAY